jgi:hypothetical protein
MTKLPYPAMCVRLMAIGARLMGVQLMPLTVIGHRAVAGVVMHRPREVALVAHSSLDSFLPLVVVFPAAALMANVVVHVKEQMRARLTVRANVQSMGGSKASV